VISTSSQSLKPSLYTRIRKFFVSKTGEIKGTREIIKESDQFFREFSVGDKVVLNIDAENDMEIRETLGAWIAPQHYKNYPQLTLGEVILDAEGSYYLKSKSNSSLIKSQILNIHLLEAQVKKCEYTQESLSFCLPFL